MHKEEHDACPLCGMKCKVVIESEPPDLAVIYVVKSPHCREFQVFINKEAYVELRRPDLPGGDRIRAALRAKLANPRLGTRDNPVTLADIREFDKIA
jgi:hypothetical protein